MSSAKLRVLLIDDEPLANREMRRLLTAHHDDVEVIGECRDADSARQAIASSRPDVIFLDISLPGEDGMALLASLDAAPMVVFVTTFNDKAIRAFELCAMDYLLKPVNPRRLSQTIMRLSTVATPAPVDDTQPLLRLSDQVFLQGPNEQLWFVTIAEVRLFEVAGDGTRVIFGRGIATTPRALRTIESRLPTNAFVRANRTQVVGLAHVREVHPWFAGRLKLKLDGGEEVIVSRRQARAFALHRSL